MSILLITHDLGIVAEMADFVAVMYAWQIVEFAAAQELFQNPLHPYTLGLFQSRPRLGQKKGRLNVIPGVVPNPIAFPPGCRFHPRCSYAAEVCRQTEVTRQPVLHAPSVAEGSAVEGEVAREHSSACLLVQNKQINLTRVQ